MKKTETTINIDDFPAELHFLFQDAKVCDSSCKTTMKVLCQRGEHDENGLPHSHGVFL